MLLVLPVPFRVCEGEMLVEAQAGNGLDRWADHFAQVVVAAAVVPESEVAGMAGMVWVSVSGLEHFGKLRFEALPQAYTPGAFVRELAGVRRRLRGMIAACEFLQFAIGGIWGDWAAVAAVEARRMGRRYAIHTDRVEHELMRKTAGGQSAVRRVKIMLEAPVMERYHRWVIEGCSLGLWHGDDCYRAYAPWCGENHLVHDVHTKVGDLIGDEELAAKVAGLRGTGRLEVCYAGRLDAMKAPLEWVRAIAFARGLGADISATWYGDGGSRAEAEAEARKLGVAVRFAGFVSGRGELLGAVRAAGLMVFTHVTPESPRNLLEALVCGTAMVGYESAYARDLLRDGGGVLVPVHDAEGLGRVVAELAGDREKLVELMLAAAAVGRRFTDVGVFAERSELVKRFA